MDPQALFLYLTQRRHFSEDVAQEVVIAYLEGRMEGAKYLKVWAAQRARWITLDYTRKAIGRGPRNLEHPRTFLSPNQQRKLPCPLPSILTKLEQRQEIEQAIPYAIRRFNNPRCNKVARGYLADLLGY